MLGHELCELRHFDLREDFGAGTFGDQVEAFGIFLRSSFITFGDVTGDG